MTGGVLVDTGPLVAIFSRRDANHDVCVEQIRDLRPPLVTWWPVVTEAAWLLRRHQTGIQALFRVFGEGMLQLAELDAQALPWLGEFLKRYHKLGAQLADGALVYLAEREAIETVFTLDRRDFSVYRLSRGRNLRILP